MNYKTISIGLAFIFFLGVAIATGFDRHDSTKTEAELKINPDVFDAYI